MKRKLFARITAMFLAAAMLSGCSSARPERDRRDSAPEAGTSDFTGEDPRLEKHLKISVNWGSEDENCDLINKICGDYQNSVNPNFTWEYEYIAPGDLMERMDSLAEEDDLPDIFAYAPGKPLEELIKSGKIVDIGTELKRMGSENYIAPMARELIMKLSGADSLYGLPMGFDIEGFWYNKSLFEQAGISIPATMDELEAELKVLYDAGIQPITADASGETGSLTGIINVVTARTAGNDAMKKASSGEAEYTDSVYAEVADKISGWAKAGYFGEDPDKVTMEEAEKKLMEGKAAILFSGSGFVKTLDSEENKAGKDGIGFFNMPAYDPSISDASSYPMNCGNILCFGKDKYDEGTAWFVKYFVEHAGDEAMVAYGTVKGYSYAAQPSDTHAYAALVLDELDRAKSGFAWYEAYMKLEAAKAARENAKLLISGDMSGEKYMGSIQEASQD